MKQNSKMKVEFVDGKYNVNYGNHSIKLDDIIVSDNRLICYYEKNVEGFDIDINSDLSRLLLECRQGLMDSTLIENTEINTNDLFFNHIDTCISILKNDYISDDDIQTCLSRLFIIKTMINIFYNDTK